MSAVSAPETSREELASIADKAFDDLVANGPRNSVWEYCIRVTSGTSGNSPLISIPTHTVPDDFAQWWQSDTRMLVVQGTMNTRLSNALACRKDPREDVPHVLLIDTHDLENNVSALLSDFAPEVLVGIPGVLLRTLPSITSETAAKVQRLHLTGELLSQAARIDLHARFPSARIARAYLTTELGILSAYPCEYTTTNSYHPRRGVLVEIDAPDTDGIGSVLVSTELRAGYPVQRYRIGDTGRLCGPCACGATDTFELLGRTGMEYAKVAGAIIRRDECERVATTHLPAGTDYRFEAGTEASSGRGWMTLHVVRAHDLSSPERETIATLIAEDLFLTPSRTLAHLVRDNLFLPFTIIWHKDPFPVPRSLKETRLIIH